MNIFEIREQLKDRGITDIPLRVVVYARVSTDKEEQASSIVNQVTCYENMIQSTPAWTHVGTFVDEGISGTSIKKRTDFNRMMEFAKNGGCDLVITKAVARFARNTLDSLACTRQLLEYNVGVWFHTDNILTFRQDDEFKLSIMSALAQEESLKKSVAVASGHKQSIKRGTVFGNGRMFGYKKEHGKLVLDESEVPIVKTIFEMYATDQYSMNEIERILSEKGYRNHNGNPISHATMAHMIRNPKYKGWYVGGKVKIVDMFTKKQMFLPESEWVAYKDETGERVPAIVDDDLWNRANQVLDRRSKDVKDRQNKCNHPNLLTGKLYCKHCGMPYHRKGNKLSNGQINSYWVCKNKIINGAKACPSRYIYESEIKKILFDVFNETKQDSAVFVERYLEIVRGAIQNGELSGRKREIESEIEMIQAKRSKLLSYNLNGQISDADFLSMNEQLSHELKKAEQDVESIDREILKSKSFEDRIKFMRSFLAHIDVDSEDVIDDVFVRKYIDRIDVEMVDGTFKLYIKLFSGANIERSIVPEKLLSGNTMLTM